MRLTKKNVLGFVEAKASVFDSLPCVRAVDVSKVRGGKNIGAGISYNSQKQRVIIYLVVEKNSGRPECIAAAYFMMPPTTPGEPGRSIKVRQTSEKIIVTLPMIFEFDSKSLPLKD